MLKEKRRITPKPPFSSLSFNIRDSAFDIRPQHSDFSIRTSALRQRPHRRGVGRLEKGADLAAQVVLDDGDPLAGVEHPEAELVGQGLVFLEELALGGAEAVVGG